MDLTEQVKNIIDSIIAGGVTATTVITAINLFKNIISGAKFNKLMNFAAVADKNIKDNQIAFSDLKKQLVADFKGIVGQVKTEIIEPVLQKTEAVLKDNVMLVDITVSLLSLVNVPLDQKKQFFTALCKISSISAEATKLLSASIESQEAQQVTEKVNDTVIEQKIINS